MKRECGECSVCCYIGAVPDLKKPAHRTCKHQWCGGMMHGCKIYGNPERPFICNNFECAWLHGTGHFDDRPDKSNVMIKACNMNGGIWLFAIENAAGAVLNEGRQMVLAAVRSMYAPMIVVDYGSHPPNDKGNRTIVRSEFMERSVKMRGESLGDLAEHIHIYELVGS